VKQRVLDAMKTKATNCRNFLSFSLLLAMSPPRTSRFTGRKLATIHTDSKPAYMRTAEQQWTMYHIWPYHTSLRLHNENPRTFSPKWRHPGRGDQFPVLTNTKQNILYQLTFF
jgi:hypothetical protein